SAGQFHIQPPANTAAGCTSAVLPNGTCIRSGVQNTEASRALRYDENPDRTIRGEVERTNFFGTMERDLAGGVQLFGEAGYYHSVFNGQREQSAPLGSARISIPANNFYNPFGPVTLNGAPNPNRLPGLTLATVPAEGLALSLRSYRPVDTGPRTYTVTDDSYRVLGGLRGEILGFDWETAVAYSEANTKDKTNKAVSNTLFQAALSRSTPDAYNPFNGGDLLNFSGPDTSPSDPATIRSFLVDVFRISHTSLALADLKFTRPDLFTLPGGEVGMAVGLEARRETYEDDRDPRADGTITYTDAVTGVRSRSDILGASPAPDVSADRSVYSAFVELVVPVISREMNIPLVQEVSLQLAARDEYYSDFGNVLKPKVAGSWQVVDWLSLRASYSESFRAPNLPQFYGAGTQVSNTRTDFIRCEQDLRAGRIKDFRRCSQSLGVTSIRSGNQNLQPEDAQSISSGLVFTSSFIPRRYGELVVTVDYWEIQQENVIGIFGDQAQLQLDYLLRVQGSSNPNVVRFAPTPEQIAATVPGIAPVGDIQFVIDDFMNIQPRTAEGLDFGLIYSVNDTGLGDFDFKLNAAKLLTLEQQPSENATLLLQAREAGVISRTINVPGAGDLIRDEANPEWRGSATLTWTYGPWRSGLLVNYIGSVLDDDIVLADGTVFEVESWTTASLYVQRDFETGILRDSSLRIGARNITDEDPPLAANNFGFLGALHNPTGRYVYAQISKRF
ncbi:MAG: TonB-dependent receptor, partial [Proteobacteria bacterium]|nr:TonB-dependent receptor [Pseudomonadota bacterium]